MFHSFRVGDREATIVSDGPLTLDGGFVAKNV